LTDLRRRATCWIVALCSTWRLSALALAALWVVTPAMAAVHGALESHSYCAEHGAFEHTPDEPGEAPAAAPGDHDDRITATPNGAADSHQMCQLGDTLLRDGVALAHPDSVTPADVAPVATVALVSQTSAAPIDPLMLAPKSSPPA
jgi:hypothetical protein